MEGIEKNMSTQKHTPAPIAVEKVGIFYSLTRPLTEQERKDFCVSPTDTRGMSLLAISKDDMACVESEGDARLWAASPKMLDALEEARMVTNDAADYFSQRNLGEPARILFGRLLAAYGKASEAIAAAKPTA